MNQKILFLFLFFISSGFIFSVQAQLNRIDKIFITKNLSGTILAPDDEPLSGCSVEKFSKDWKLKINSTKTDLNGKFKFPKATGTFYLRINCSAFQTYEIKVITNQKSKKNLILTLETSI